MKKCKCCGDKTKSDLCQKCNFRFRKAAREMETDGLTLPLESWLKLDVNKRK